MNYCILGIGNIGEEYEKTRHNVGFILLDQIAKKNNCEFLLKKHAYITSFQYRGHTINLIKPTTFVNNSGIALRYWMEKLTPVKKENILIVVDDINLDFGHLRFRNDGSDGGHNGLKSIAENFGSNKYNRLRVGIGHNFQNGKQADYVIGNFKDEELKTILQFVNPIEDIIKSLIEQNEEIRKKMINDILSKIKIEN